jgi:shikimate kinase
MNNITLIGLPGSGKTTLGRALAEALGRPFVDIDRRILHATKMTVDEIFGRYGEAFFRDLEAGAILGAVLIGSAVITPGGGAVLRDDNVKKLRGNGLVIFLDRPVERIAADIDISRRPLLKAGVGSLYALAEARRARYLTSAHITVANDGAMDDALFRLIAEVRKVRDFPN